MQRIDLPPAEQLEFTVVNTGISHTLASGEYALRRQSCMQAERDMGISLRDAKREDVIAGVKDLTDSKRALHVVEENIRVDHAVNALQMCDLTTFGEILITGHESLKELYEVTIPEHDVIVDSACAMKADGVYGARMTGGGFGGSVIVAHTPLIRDSLCENIREKFKSTTGRYPELWQVHSVNGAGIIC